MHAFNNYIFDLDGTLIDSTPSHVRAFNIAIKSSAANMNAEFEYEKMKGMRTIDVMKRLGFSEGESLRLTKIKQEAYRNLLAKGEVKLFDGVSKCFEMLKSLDKGIYICTGASRDSVEIILQKFKLSDKVDYFITGSDVDEAKPSPQILNKLLKDNDISASECLFVEDSENGKECGIGAGVKTIIVNNPSIMTSDDFITFNDFYLALQETL